MWDLPIFKALCGADPEQKARTFHESNQEYLLVFKAQHGDDPQIQSGTPPFLWLHAGLIHKSNTSHVWTIHESNPNIKHLYIATI